jgi:hypothetical protein
MADMQYPSTNIGYDQDVVVFCAGRRTDIVNCIASWQSPRVRVCTLMGSKLIAYTDTFSQEAIFCVDRSQTLEGRAVENDSHLVCGVPLLGAPGLYGLTWCADCGTCTGLACHP